MEIVMKIEVLGTGCAKCTKMAERVTTAATELGIEFELVKVTSIVKIMEFGVMTTPALVVDGEVKIAGRLPSVADIKTILGNG
jgi:small redox-active disulfide protein 2